VYSYVASTFFIQYEHHCAVRSQPKFVHSKDPSYQLNLTKIGEDDSRKGNLCKNWKTASQWQNSLAELSMEAFKETLAKVTSGNMMN
jgi:hypothetical protein